MTEQKTNQQRIVLVTGPGGAGRSTAINVLEDFGYETIDNIPLSFVPRLVDTTPVTARPVALGIDVRNRDFSVEGLLELMTYLKVSSRVEADLFYLDCEHSVLVRRYSETRRRHPLAPDETPGEGILRELALLEDVRKQADVLVDTSALTVHDLKSEMEGWFNVHRRQGMAISVQSFSYKRGVPQGLDMVFDCRFLRNPHWEPHLRPLTGLDADIASYVKEDSRYQGFFDRVSDLASFVIPACLEEGKAHFSLGFGCTGGKHRSVTLAESVAEALAHGGLQVSIRHRELERRGQTSLNTQVRRQLGKVAE
ncbi:MAG: RNase adapter RapZ [Pelagimonas sp.]|nr:RNase adapter RapZ [Pelagimonas sp.]